MTPEQREIKRLHAVARASVLRAAMYQTDWHLLAQQKQALVEIVKDNPLLDGLLNWIDAVQDAAELEGFPVQWLTESEPADEIGSCRTSTREI